MTCSEVRKAVCSDGARLALPSLHPSSSPNIEKGSQRCERKHADAPGEEHSRSTSVTHQCENCGKSRFADTESAGGEWEPVRHETEQREKSHQHMRQSGHQYRAHQREGSAEQELAHCREQDCRGEAFRMTPNRMDRV